MPMMTTTAAPTIHGQIIDTTQPTSSSPPSTTSSATPGGVVWRIIYAAASSAITSTAFRLSPWPEPNWAENILAASALSPSEVRVGLK